MKQTIGLLILASQFGLSCTENYIVGPDGLTNPAVKPTVVYTFPPMNSQGPYDLSSLPYEGGNILLRFNKYMEIGSVRRAVSVISSCRSVRTDSNHVYGEFERYYVYILDTSGYPIYDILTDARIKEQLTVVVDTSALDVNGNRMPGAFRTTFIPEPVFRVRNVYPTDRIIDVSDAYSSNFVSLHFNSQFSSSMFSKFQWTPSVVGRWSFEDYSDSSAAYFQFQPQRLPDSMVLSIGKEMHDIYGNSLSQNVSATFRRGAFRIRSYGVPQNIDDEVALTSTEPLDSTALQASFHITPNVPGTLVLEGYGSFLVFSHRQDFLQNTSYEVTLDTTIRSIFGGRLERPFKMHFTPLAFRMTWSTPSAGAINVPDTQ